MIGRMVVCFCVVGTTVQLQLIMLSLLWTAVVLCTLILPNV